MKTAYLALSFLGLLCFAVVPMQAQIELTSDMIWQEGTHWVYPCEVFTDMYGHTVGPYMRECRIERSYDYNLKDTVLMVETRTNYGGSWDDDWDFGGTIEIDQNKVSGVSSEYNYEDRTYSAKYFLMYDFETWVEGATIRFEKDSGFDFPEIESAIVKNLERITTDPDKNYYSYAFSGTDDRGFSFYYIKNIGRVQDKLIKNLSFYYIPYRTFWDSFGGDEGIMALKIWHPDLGVLYQHPEYDRYMALTSGIESVEADAAGEPVIAASDGMVRVTVEELTEVTICTPAGAVLRRESIAGTASYSLAPGIYIVRAGAVTRKVRV